MYHIIGCHILFISFIGLRRGIYFFLIVFFVPVNTIFNIKSGVL